jgi:hypothetical protein
MSIPSSGSAPRVTTVASTLDRQTWQGDLLSWEWSLRLLGGNFSGNKWMSSGER